MRGVSGVVWERREEECGGAGGAADGAITHMCLFMCVHACI